MWTKAEYAKHYVWELQFKHTIYLNHVDLLPSHGYLWPSDAIWQQILFNIRSGNGLLPDGTKLLSEPIMPKCQLGPKE